MNELSLFTGAGGGLLGTKLLRFKHIGYVEWDEYCQKTLSQRVKDGFLDEAPIFSDIRAFIGEGYASSYQGLVDVITAGPPCQPVSNAGKRQAEKDERNRWPETLECIRIIRPQFVFMENPPALLSFKLIQYIFGKLAESGYNAFWRCLSAAEVGAPHLRDRLWILAYDDDSTGSSEFKQQQSEWPKMSESGRRDIPDIDEERLSRVACSELRGVFEETGTFQGCESCGGVATARGGWWKSEPGLVRMVHGGANRVDRITSLGNMQVPGVVATAWRLLTQ